MGANFFSTSSELASLNKSLSAVFSLNVALTPECSFITFLMYIISWVDVIKLFVMKTKRIFVYA